MELALSLGDASRPFLFLDKAPKMDGNMDIGFCMGLGTAAFSAARSDESSRKSTHEAYDQEERRRRRSRVSSDPPLQLNLLPSAPVPRSHASSQLRFPWLTDNLAVSELARSSDGPGIRLDVNRMPGVVASAEEAEDAAAPLSSPNSTVSSFQMDFGMRNGGRSSKRDLDVDADRASDDEENGSTRKKLRLSKDQSAFLEESFKEHSTLNPKQKLALAKQLNLRPRQVEVWFQNRRARTKLKQTEVDCEYLKRCCETLTEENRRLQKELQDLRALKTSQPFYMQLPATTLTMCPSCERVVTTASANTTTTTITNNNNNNNNNNNHHHIKSALNNKKPRLNPFAATQVHMQQHQGAAA